MTGAHTNRAHAKLAPSAASRWVACPGSIRMSRDIPDRSSSYANEGTAAHELAAHCLTERLDADRFLGCVIDIRASTPSAKFSSMVAHDGLHQFAADDEMVEAVQLYLDTVRSHIPVGESELDIEQRLDMTHIHKGIFGTGDTVLYDLDAATLHVFDFKYGKGVAVNPDENPQLLLYGAGAVRRRHNRPLKKIVLHIVQPRAPHPKGPVRSWETDPLALMEAEDEIAVAAKATDDPNAPLNAGEWCRFCPAAPICPALRQRSLMAAMAEFSLEVIGNWLRAVQEFAHAEAVDGRIPPGFKLVAKRATRRWRDENEMLDALIDYPREELFVEPKVKSPAQIEKLVGKKNFGVLEGIVVRESSGTNLVPEDDPKPAVKVSAEKEFA
jgi:hypothetical protein